MGGAFVSLNIKFFPKYNNFFGFPKAYETFWGGFVYFPILDWKMQASISENVRKDFFSKHLRKAFLWESIRKGFWWKNIRIFLILRLESSISEIEGMFLFLEI